ncbi:unnamed protein product, partial [Polarella glacialis]
VRLAVSSQQVWDESSRSHWMRAWWIVWLLQAPFWLAVLPSSSVLLVHEQVNFAVTVHHAVLRHLGRGMMQLPSAGIVAYTDSSQRSNFMKIMSARCGLPLLYVLGNGLPSDWKQVAILLALDVGPPMVSVLAKQAGLCSRRSTLGLSRPWQLSYPPAHDSSAAGVGDEDECSEHGSCPICFGNFCCPGGGTVVARMAVAIQHTSAPGLSVARLRSTPASASLSAARTRCSWMGGRIAETRCGHRFHAECIAKAAETMPRCPQCRAGLGSASHQLHLPSE